MTLIRTPRRARSIPDRARPARALAGSLRGQRGASPVELAILMPGILLLLFASIQVAALYLARTSALHAAQEAVSAERMYGAEPGSGRARAVAFLGQAGDWLDNPQIVGENNGEVVTYTVSGDAVTLLPGVTFEVEQQAYGPIEQFTTDADEE